MKRRGFLIAAMAAGPLNSFASSDASRKSTWHQRRFKNIEEQAYDMSCGAATLAALLNRYTALKWTEADVIKGLVDIVPKERQELALKDGFSLLDMKLLMKAQGYDLKAIRRSHEQLLIDFASPAVLQMQYTGGKHFVLWHGRHRDYHWVSDPSRGDMWLSSDELFSHWTLLAAWAFKDDKPIPGPLAHELSRAYAQR